MASDFLPFFLPDNGCFVEEVRQNSQFAFRIACGHAATVERLRRAGARFRNEIVTGVGGKQILVEDPSGNPIELFEPILPEARLNQPG